MNTETISIGQRLAVVPVAPADLNKWHASCPMLPHDWLCHLVHRAPSEIMPNFPPMVWVLEIDPNSRHLLVSDSSFGFLPISDRMRPRYIRSLEHVAAVIRGEVEQLRAEAECFSEVKGMFSRCWRRDQWDWRAVHIALGEPTCGHAKRLANALGEAGAAHRSRNGEECESYLAMLRQGDIASVLQQAAQTIMATAPKIANAQSTRRRRDGSSQKGQGGKGRSILSDETKRKLDSANITHAELLEALNTFLVSQGHKTETNQFVDAFARLKSGPAIFEAKSVTGENEISQVRQGLSQLYEYRFRHELRRQRGRVYTPDKTHTSLETIRASVKDGDQTPYLVRRTKGIRNFLKLRTGEADNVRCSQKHFELSGVPFAVTVSADEV